jgi:hypothetical protein
MDDDNRIGAELADLRSRVTALEAEIAHDTTTRKELLEATGELLPALAKRAQQNDQFVESVAVSLAAQPQLQRARTDALLSRHATLSTRVLACEQGHGALLEMIVSQQQLMREVLEILRPKPAA